MVLNKEKLMTILVMELNAGLNVKNLKYYQNNSFYTKIFSDYNKDQPLCYKLANNSKNRKMILKRIRSLLVNSEGYDSDFHNVGNSKKSDVCNKIEDITEEFSNKVGGQNLTELEKYALDALISLKEGKHDTLQNLSITEELSNKVGGPNLTELEKYALDALISLKEGKNDPLRNKNITEDFPNKVGGKNLTEHEIYALDALISLKEHKPIPLHHIKEKSIFEEKTTQEMSTNFEIETDKKTRSSETQSPMDKRGSKDIEYILKCFLEEVKLMLRGALDKFSNCNKTNENCISLNRDTNNKKSFKESSTHSKGTKNLEKCNKPFGPFETEDCNLDVSQFESYRKSDNPKEKINKRVFRVPGKAVKQIRRFKPKVADCNFKINPDLLFEANDVQNLKLTKKKLIIDVLRQEYLKINNACIISFFNIKYLVSGLLAYGYCTFADCCKYRFKVNLDGTVFVYRTGEIIHAIGEKRVAQIRGVTRAIAKKNLQNKSAYIYRKEKILEASDEIAQSGNFQNIQKLPTLRKCKSEYNFDNFCDPNPFIDVYRMQQGYYLEYIQYIASPLAIHCWADKTFETFCQNPQILKDANHTIHFDATGQSVRQIECAEKRVLIYKMVIRIKKLKMIIPVLTAILSRHTIVDICLIFERLQIYCKEHKYKWPFFERVCTDVSYALFGGILKCCNDQNVSEYLSDCFKYLENKSLTSRPRVIVQWCKAHYIHIICKDLNMKIGKKHKLRHLLKSVLTLAFDLKTMDECKFWFKHIFIVLLSPQKNHDFKNSYAILKKHFLDINENDYENMISFDDEQLNNLESIASRSPFKKVFENICNYLYDSFNDQIIKYDINEYQNEDFCKFIVKKYCPFLPMWTNIMGIVIDPSGDHISNAPVEFNFYLQKHILLNNRAVRPGDFIKIDRKDSMSSLKELRYQYDMFDVEENEEKEPIINEKHGLLQIAKEHDYELIELLEPEETWKKKSLKKQKAIKPKHLLNAKKVKKLFAMPESIEDIIKLDAKNETNSREVTRIKKEHTYYDPMKFEQLSNKKQTNVNLYLFRYNSLFKKIYPNLKQSDISFYNILDIEDWKSIKIGNQLTNFVVDCAILSIIKENFKNVLSLPCQLDTICFTKLNKLILYKPNYIIIPILKSRHFNLCILNLLHREFIFIDSFSDFSGQEHWESFYTHFCKDKEWKFLKVSERTRQSDGVSCGVFVIMYILHYLSGKSLLKLPDPNNFRETIRSVLTRNSDNCSQFCCHCGNVKRLKTKCNSCQYTVCKECVIKIYNNSFNTCRICTDKIFI